MKRTTVDETTLTSMFPNRDCTGGNANSFANYLKFGTSSVEKGFRVFFDSFFDANGELDATATFGGATKDCRADAASCWTLFKSFLANDTTAQANMQKICKTLYDSLLVDRELEQSAVRIQASCRRVVALSRCRSRCRIVALSPRCRSAI